MGTKTLAWVISVTMLVGAPAWAADPAARCEAQKVKAIGKYVGCLANLDAKAAIRGEAVDPADTARCADKFLNSWDKAQANGDGLCSNPPGADASIAQATAALCEAWAAGYVQGGDADICAGACDTCTADLATCNNALGTCDSNLNSCSDDFAACMGSLSSVESDLSTCSATLTTCNGGLTTCNVALTTCNADFVSCAADLAACNTGTAVASDVLSGETFSSGAGLGLSGAMPNVGQQNLTPGTSSVTIAQGYHDGTGQVAGDPDLVAGNIKQGVNLFGVAGTLPQYPSATGQTTSYGAGDDGDLELGAPLQFVDNGDGTIADLNTGLMWEKKVGMGASPVNCSDELGSCANPHDADNMYRWTVPSGPSQTYNGVVVTIFLNQLNNRCSSNASIACVTNADCSGVSGPCGFAGYRDWRLPNRKELDTLVDAQRQFPATPTAFHGTSCGTGCTDVALPACSCTRSSPGYWSSSTNARTPSEAWLITFEDGTLDANAKTSEIFARAVRGP